MIPRKSDPAYDSDELHQMKWGDFLAVVEANRRPPSLWRRFVNWWTLPLAFLVGLWGMLTDRTPDPEEDDDAEPIPH